MYTSHAQISFAEKIKLSAIQIKGDNLNSWVTQFSLSMWNEENSMWQTVKENGSPISFEANDDAETIVEVYSVLLDLYDPR